ncbi:MAG: hypothetical protein QGF46_00255, partial [Planctomycetota bacterium]|nr:hypothetical protein [Planctomycetota bacterium]
MEWTVEDSIIAANAMKGLGPARINKLIKSGDIVRFISGHSDVNNLYSNMQLQRQTAREVNAQFVPASSEYYPAALQHLEHPPPLLHAIGDLNL